MTTKLSNLDFLIINDDHYYFDIEEGLNLYQIALLNDIQLPRFCYHNKLSIAGNCRVCLIEIDKNVKLTISCSLAADKSSNFFTSSKSVKDSQEFIFEYLLINHPLDCPICDQGGECDLQDQVIVFGTDRGRFYEDFKRSVFNKNYGPLVKFVLNRCIHCSRCIRFLWELAEDDSLVFINRGYEMQISSYVSKFINTELSGNIIDLCPVGALTSKPYAFVARYWELYSIKLVDIMDCTHSNIDMSFRGTSIMRILPIVNDHLNEDWITDKIRFFYDSIIAQRILKPFFLFKFKKYHISWLNTFYYLKSYFFNLINFFFKKKISFILSTVLFGELYNCQETVLLKDFSNKLSLPYLKYCYNVSSISSNSDLRYFYLFKNKLATIVDDTSLVKFYFLFCTNLRFESPIVNIRIKQIYGTQIFLWGYLSNFNQDYIHLGTNIFSILFFVENVVLLDYYFKNFFQSNFIVGLNYTRYISDILWLQLFLGYREENKHFFVDMLHVNNLDVVVKEFNLNGGGILDQSCINYLYNWYYLLSPDNFNWKLKFNKFTLLFYQGFQADYFIKYSKLAVPSRLFMEKPSFYINLEGLVQDLKFFFFRFNFKTVKNDTAILFSFFDLFGLKYNYTRSTLEKDIRLIEVSSSFNTNLTAYYLTILDFKFFRVIASVVKKMEFINVSLPSFLNNFYSSNILVRNSNVLTLASKSFTVLNDFKYMYNNLLED